MKREQKWKALQASIREMTTTPGSSVALCHQQGKTAVYLADDGSLVEVPPGGTRDESMPRSDAATRIEIGAEEGRALLIIIGANGAGKTTLGRAYRRWLPRPYYNVDVLADGLGDADDPILQREARALVDERIESHLRVGETFGFESTYSGRSRPEIVRRAKDTGYVFSAAALKCRARDAWVGWDFRCQYGRLHLVSNNTRLLLLPGPRHHNLGSRVLGLCARRIVRDWPARFGHPLVLLETFVDPARFHGTVYRAANWLCGTHSRVPPSRWRI